MGLPFCLACTLIVKNNLNNFFVINFALIVNYNRFNPLRLVNVIILMLNFDIPFFQYFFVLNINMSYPIQPNSYHLFFFFLILFSYTHNYYTHILFTLLDVVGQLSCCGFNKCKGLQVLGKGTSFAQNIGI